MRQRIKGKNSKSKKSGNQRGDSWFSKVRSNSPIRNLYSVVLPLLVFAGFGYFLIPKGSMIFMNNDVPAVDFQHKTVLFYNSNCSHCQKIYPSVFWYNMEHFNDPANQVQTINVQNPNNKHYITDYQLTSVPTFMSTSDNNNRLVTDNKTILKNYLERR